MVEKMRQVADKIGRRQSSQMPSWQKAIDKALKSNGGILTQWETVQDVLRKHQLLYRDKVRPDAFLVHPTGQKRSGNQYVLHV